MVHDREDIVGLDSSILMSPKVWKASGHLTAGFADPMMECKLCKNRFRVDDYKSYKLDQPGEPLELLPSEVDESNIEIIECPFCGKSGKLLLPRQFNLMMKTFVGPVEDEAATTYLRAETCQGIYVNFKNVLDTMRMKVPFGVAQIGKAFRNEITPGNFIYRTREFEQMEQKFFIKPGDNKKWFEYWKEQRLKWYIDLGIKKENLKFHEHAKDELAHYAKAAFDIEYNFPFDNKELEGLLHISETDINSNEKLESKFKLGDEIDVKILRVDGVQKKIALSRKDL